MSDAAGSVPDQQVDTSHLDSVIATVATAAEDFGLASQRLSSQLQIVHEAWASPASRRAIDLREQLLLRTTALGGRLDELLARLKATRKAYDDTTSTNVAMWTS